MWTVAHETPNLSAAKLGDQNKAAVSVRCDRRRDGRRHDDPPLPVRSGHALCRGGNEAVTAASPPDRVQALRKIYDGPHNPGRRGVSSRGPAGSEVGGGNGWQIYIVDPPEPPRVGSGVLRLQRSRLGFQDLRLG
jgi:hypothetical protein